MKRKDKKFIQFTDQLDKQLEKSIDIFFEQRKFLLDFSEPEITSMTDELIEDKIQNQYAIEFQVNAIKHLAYEQ